MSESIDQKIITYVSLSATCASLEKDVIELKKCMDIIHETVEMQQPTMDSIEDAIRASQEDAKKAQQQLVATDAYQSRYQYIIAAAGSAVIGLVTLLFIL